MVGVLAFRSFNALVTKERVISASLITVSSLPACLPYLPTYLTSLDWLRHSLPAGRLQNMSTTIPSNVPLGPPPPGVTSDFSHPIDDQHFNEAVAVTVIFVTISTLCVLARVWSRVFISKLFGWDDGGFACLESPHILYSLFPNPLLCASLTYGFDSFQVLRLLLWYFFGIHRCAGSMSPCLTLVFWDD